MRCWYGSGTPVRPSSPSAWAYALARSIGGGRGQEGQIEKSKEAYEKSQEDDEEGEKGNEEIEEGKRVKCQGR
jgi:hypothetical protein